MITRLLHNIGTIEHVNYNTREEILACDDTLTFDGVYRNVWENRDVLRGKKVTLFVMGKHVGGDNSFDKGMPYEKYCDWNQIMQLVVEYKCKLGWHTWSHKRLDKISEEEMGEEVMPPFPMDYFAYPHGRYNDKVVDAVERSGFTMAYGAGKHFGEGMFKIKRRYL